MAQIIDLVVLNVMPQKRSTYIRGGDHPTSPSFLQAGLRTVSGLVMSSFSVESYELSFFVRKVGSTGSKPRVKRAKPIFLHHAGSFSLCAWTVSRPCRKSRQITDCLIFSASAFHSPPCLPGSQKARENIHPLVSKENGIRVKTTKYRAHPRGGPACSLVCALLES